MNDVCRTRSQESPPRTRDQDSSADARRGDLKAAALAFAPDGVVKAYDGTAGVREFERLGRAIEAARLTVQIAAAYPLRQAAKAQARIEKGHVLGKVVLRIRGRT